MKRFYFVAFALLITQALHAQSVGLTWAKSIGAGGDDLLQVFTVDGSGNVYIAGAFRGTVDFDPGPGVTSLVSAGGKDAFFAKYNSFGTLIWVNQIGSSTNDEIYGIAVDGSGNVYVAGYFSGSTVDFNPDPITASTLSALGFEDGFFGKYSSTGALHWANRLGSSTHNDYCYAIALDASNNVYVTGVFGGQVDFDPTAGTESRTSVGGNDSFFGKYLNNGSLSWINQLGSSGDDFFGSISISGSIAWIGGSYGGAINLNPNGTSQFTGLPIGGVDAIYVEYNITSGLFNGSYGTVQSSGDDEVHALYYDGTSLITAGDFAGTTAGVYGGSGTGVTLTAAGGKDGFFTRHNTSTMTLSFAKSIGGVGNDGINHMAVDPAKNNIYLAGFFSGTADFNPDAGTLNLVSAGDIDAFFARYSATNGALVYANPLGSTGTDQASCILADASDNVYVGGVFDGTVDFDPAGTTNLSSNGLWDCFFAKYELLTSSNEPTAQPTNLVFSNHTGFGFDWSFTAASGNPDGYLGVYRIGAAPTGVPDDGIEYEFGDAIGDATVLWSHSSTTGWTWSGAAANSNYHIAIYAYNGSGSARNYRTTSPLRNNATTLTQAAQPTAAPTAFTYSNVTATGFTVSFTASSPAATGYIAFRNDEDFPDVDLSNGKTYTVGATMSDGSVVAYVGSATTFSQSGLLVDTEYNYRIFAYNGSGTSIHYLKTSSLTGWVSTLSQAEDNIPPQITDTTPTSITPNTSIVVKLAVTDAGSGVSTVEVSYYPINSYDYNSGYAVRTTGNNFEYTIPASYVREQGVEYEVIATDLAGNEAYTDFKQVIVEHQNDGLAIPYNSAGTSATNYRIISVPLTLEKKSVNDVFSDDLGAPDKSKWRLYRYSGGSTREHSGSIELGQGYWFISSEQKTIDTGPGKTADVGIGKPFRINLVNGWNQIGNPFNFNVAWADIVAENDDAGIGNLRVYNGASGWSNSNTLPRMGGGFVMSQGAYQLYVPVVKGARTMPLPKPNFAQPLGSDIWAVDVKVTAAGIVNEFGGFGMHTGAKDANDKFDDFTLPRFTEYLELNHHKKFAGAPFTKDIVPTATEYTWTFDVESNLLSDVVELSWDNSTLGDNQWQLVLWDDTEQRAINMRSHRSYSFNGHSRSFKVFFGDSDYIGRNTNPARMVFHSVSPVPASDRVTFAFSVPEADAGTETTLDVYNLMGQRMTRLVEEPLQAGYHEAVWVIEQGRKPAPGVYISVLKSGNAVTQKRLVIK